MTKKKYEVHPRLAGRMRDLSPLEFQQLTDNCLEDGEILDPIFVWGKYYIDGRHRHEIATKHGLNHNIVEKEFDSIDDAEEWVIAHQLGRRNVTGTELQRLRADKARLEGTASVAAAHDVSQRTVQRDVKREKGRQLLPDDIREKVESGSTICQKVDLELYADLSPQQRSKVDKALRDDPTATMRLAIPQAMSGLTKEDFEAIKESKLSGPQKQSISLGTIPADSRSVRILSKMDPGEQMLVSEVLVDLASLKDAVDTVKSAQKAAPPSSAKMVQNVEKACSRVSSIIEELSRLHPDGAKEAKAREHLMLLEGGLQTWARK